MAMDPTVRKHLLNKYYPNFAEASADDRAVQDAEERAQYAPYLAGIGALTEAAIRPKDSSVSYMAGFGQSQGGGRQIQAPKQMDWGKVAGSGREGIERAERKEDREQERALRRDQMEQSSAEGEIAEKERIKKDDTNSPTAKNAQLLAKSALSSKAKEAEAAGDKEGAKALRQQALSMDGMTATEAAGIIELSKSTDYKDVLNNLSAERRQSQLIKNDKDKGDKSDREITFRLSEKYNADPTTKATAEVRTALEKAQTLAANPSATNDISLIFNYMKANDPGSTVREGEFAMAAKAGSFGDQIAGMVERAESGQLTPDKRKAILDSILKQADSQEKRQLQVDGYFSDLAVQYKAKPELIVGQKRSTFGSAAAPAGGGASAPKSVGHGSNLPD